MKELLIVRHAKSSWSNPKLTDKERPLNNRGQKDGPRMASYVRSIGLKPQILVSSPATRANLTARYFQKEFNLEIITEFDLYFGGEGDYLDVVQNLDSQFDCVAIFGHNPMITYFVNEYSKEYISNVPTCGVSHIISSCSIWDEFNPSNSKLKAYHFPKLVL